MKENHQPFSGSKESTSMVSDKNPSTNSGITVMGETSSWNPVVDCVGIKEHFLAEYFSTLKCKATGRTLKACFLIKLDLKGKSLVYTQRKIELLASQLASDFCKI